MKKLTGLLIVWHRLLGVGSCLFFAMWFVSGVVMMYWRMPELTEAQRLQHEPPLDLSELHTTPAEALQGSDRPLRVVLAMAGARPVYRILGESGNWRAVYGDDGTRLDPLPPANAVALAKPYAGPEAPQLTARQTLTDVDQWTVYPGSRPYLPFQLVAANDPAGTEYYVSGATGQLFLITTSHGRLMAWVGAIPHWWYLRALRTNTPLWRWVMILASGIGVAMCIAGIAAGILRYSPSKRYRFRGLPNSSFPHTGMKRWHYYLGFAFGSITFTWILSGLFSMNPGHWSPGPMPDAEETMRFAGGAVRPELFQLSPAAALKHLSQCSGVTEMEMAQVDSHPYYLAKYAAQGSIAVSTLLSAAQPAAYCETSLPIAALQSAGEAMMHTPAAESVLLTDYDSYYYDQHGHKRLPVLRLKFNDGNRTWLYLNPNTLSLDARYTQRSRVERWVYNGLHTLDFPFLYRRRPLWDVIVIALSVGGLALSATGVVLGWRYLRRSRKRKPSQIVHQVT